MINFKLIWILYGMLGIKIFIILIFLFGNIFSSTLHVVRCIVIHLIHFILLGIFTLFQLYSNDNS
jgi:hypothetical protein